MPEYTYDPTNPTGGVAKVPLPMIYVDPDLPPVGISGNNIIEVYDELPLLEKIQAQLHDRDGAAAGHTDNANAILHLGLATKALRERDRAAAAAEARTGAR